MITIINIHPPVAAKPCNKVIAYVQQRCDLPKGHEGKCLRPGFAS